MFDHQRQRFGKPTAVGHIGRIPAKSRFHELEHRTLDIFTFYFHGCPFPGVVV